MQLGAPLYTHNHLFSRSIPYGAFDTEKKLLEDREFVANLYKNAQSVFVSDHITYCYVDSPESAVHNVTFDAALTAIKVDYDLFNYELQNGFFNPGFTLLIDRIYTSYKDARTNAERKLCLDYLYKEIIKGHYRDGIGLRVYVKYLLLKIKKTILSFNLTIIPCLLSVCTLMSDDGTDSAEK